MRTSTVPTTIASSLWLRSFRVGYALGGNRFDLPEDLLAVLGQAFSDRANRVLQAREGSLYLRPTQHRAITHLETAKLQGFPDDRPWVGSKTAIAKQIGNAVPTALGRAIAAQLLQHF